MLELVGYFLGTNKVSDKLLMSPITEVSVLILNIYFLDVNINGDITVTKLSSSQSSSNYIIHRTTGDMLC